MSLEIPAVNGTYVRKSSAINERLHDLAVNTSKVSAGTLVVKARKPGSSIFESIPDNTINLASPHSILFEGTVADYEFTLSGVAGTGPIPITDTATGGR